MNLFITLLVIHSLLIPYTLWLACGKPRPRARNPFWRCHGERANRRTYHRTLRLAVLSGQIQRWA